MTEIKIRKIELESEYVADPKLQAYNVEFEITESDNTKTLHFISIAVLDENSLKLMLPDILKQYMKDLIQKPNISLIEPEKSIFNYDEKTDSIL